MQIPLSAAELVITEVMDIKCLRPKVTRKASNHKAGKRLS